MQRAIGRKCGSTHTRKPTSTLPHFRYAKYISSAKKIRASGGAKKPHAGRTNKALKRIRRKASKKLPLRELFPFIHALKFIFFGGVRLHVYFGYPPPCKYAGSSRHNAQRCKDPRLARRMAQRKRTRFSSPVCRVCNPRIRRICRTAAKAADTYIRISLFHTCCKRAETHLSALPLLSA